MSNVLYLFREAVTRSQIGSKFFKTGETRLIFIKTIAPLTQITKPTQSKPAPKLEFALAIVRSPIPLPYNTPRTNYSDFQLT